MKNLMSYQGLLCCILVAGCHSQELPNPGTAEEFWQRGLASTADLNQAQKYFRQSAQEYWELWRHTQRPEFALRSGHSYYLAGDRGKATLLYELGLLRHPWNRELQQARQVVQQEILEESGQNYSASDNSLLGWWLDNFRPTLGLVLLVFLNTAACFAWIKMMWSPSKRIKLLFWICGTLTVMLLVVLLSTRALLHSREVPPRAVLQEKSFLYRGNSVNYPKVFETRLAAGTIVFLRHQRGDWVQVELAEQKLGWIPASRLLKIEPK